MFLLWSGWLWWFINFFMHWGCALICPCSGAVVYSMGVYIHHHWGIKSVCSFCASKDRVRVSTGSTYICIYLWCTETWKKTYITMTEGAVALSHIYIFTLSTFARWKQQKNIPWFNPQPVSNFVSPYRHNQVLAFCMIILKLDSVASGWLIYSI